MRRTDGDDARSEFDSNAAYDMDQYRSTEATARGLTYVTSCCLEKRPSQRRIVREDFPVPLSPMQTNFAI